MIKKQYPTGTQKSSAGVEGHRLCQNSLEEMKPAQVGRSCEGVIVRAKEVFLRGMGYGTVGGSLGKYWLCIVSGPLPVDAPGVRSYL